MLRMLTSYTKGCGKFARISPLLTFTSLLTFITLTVMNSACSGKRGNTGGTWIGTTETEGPITTVSTLDGSVWSGTAHLEEILTIGSEDQDAYRLGEVRAITFTDDVIYAVDLAVPVIRMYDHNGRHAGNIGRRGEGPGEFERPLTLGVDIAGGRIFVRDSIKARINVYTPGGEPVATWRIQTSRPFTSPLVISSEGTPYTQVVINPSAPYAEQKTAMASCGPEGIGSDTIAVPEIEFRKLEVEWPGGTRSMIRSPVPFGPERVWAMTPDRAMVVGASSAYRFEIRYPDGGTTVIEKPWVRVPVKDEEAAWMKGRELARIRRDAPGWEWQGPGIPAFKPAFQRFLPDRDGRIWVVRQGPGKRLEGGVQEPENWLDYFRKPCWEDTYLLDVFEEGGRYLGDVAVPPGLQFTTPPCIQGDRVLALVTDAEGVHHVSMYKLVLP